jgi:DNA polymerase I-like protein with 3'-5' exonuclease and polymerase domains
VTDGSTIGPDGFTRKHAEFLSGQAVDLEFARDLGIRSLVSREDTVDLPDPWPNFANFPAILFPWTGPDGHTEYQVRPDRPTTGSSGRPNKYMFRRGMTPLLWAVRPIRDSTSSVLVVEGTKQCVVAAQHAPDDMAVYGMAGCRMWQAGGTSIPDLMVVEGLDVVVLLDADAAGNPDVYSAGMGLAEALHVEGAESVRFARIPGKGTTALDDAMSVRPLEKRSSYLGRLIDRAKTKPADARPTAKRSEDGPPTDGGGRPTIVCNRDRRSVIDDLSEAMISRWDRTRLFDHGDVISQLRGGIMRPVDRGSFKDLVQETAITVDEIKGAKGTHYRYGWPDASTMEAVASRADRFSRLQGISDIPIVRGDGTVVSDPGYDPDSQMLIRLDGSLSGIEVPEDPTSDQVKKARDLVMDEWLGDFPFPTDSDRANALGLVVTPVIRGLVPVVPMAVVDGQQPGVGKNLLMDVIHTVHTGSTSSPMNFVDDAAEVRKQITSAFRTGARMFVFDEAHEIEGTALAQALTASTWQDRILGVSTMAAFPNQVTWVSLGNNVQVRGDLARRVYRIAIRPSYDDPQDRPSDLFRHPGQSGLDLLTWTRMHRRELVQAVLTLVRAWFAAGSPRAGNTSFGSFEAWERIVGGIVGTAGISGFLGNRKIWRSESDYDTQYWISHMLWLVDKFGDATFRTADVKREAMSDPSGFEAPPGLDDVADKRYSKALGEAYGRIRGRRYDGMRLERSGRTQRNVSIWKVLSERDKVQISGEPNNDLPGGGDEQKVVQVDASIDRSSPPWVPIEEESVKSTGLVTFDLETCDAGDMYRSNGQGFVRMAGAARDDRPVIVADGDGAATLATTAIRGGSTVTGHNIIGFDLPALVQDGKLTMADVHQMASDGRLFDAMIAARYLDPPMARDTGVDATRRYGLDHLCETFGLGRKVSGVGDLVKKYGGWGNIPTSPDDPDGAAFRDYLVQDVRLSRLLYRHQMRKLGGRVPEYLAREHRVAALAAQMTHNGFRVDVDAVRDRIAEIEERKYQAIQYLSSRHGIPIHNAKGQPYTSPLATKAGKAALERALAEAGVKDIRRTESSGQIRTDVAYMGHLGAKYRNIREIRGIVSAVRAVVGARTVYETVLNNLCGDRVHSRVSLRQATGRWSLTKPGLTVMGKRGGRHVERMIFLPEPGHVILAVDLSQVDMRAVAGLSQDQAYIRMLMEEDPHAEIARALFGSVDRRDDAKAIGHGWNYGRGLRAISEGQKIAPELVKQFDRSMRERFPRLVEWQNEVREQAASGELLDNGFGRLMRPDPQRAHTQGPALMGQGGARDIMMTGLLRLAERHPDILPCIRAQVHDEIVLSVPSGDAEDISRAVVSDMEFEWKGVPITADAGPVGQTWGHCYVK